LTFSDINDEDQKSQKYADVIAGVDCVPVVMIKIGRVLNMQTLKLVSEIDDNLRKTAH